ncbi:hypothetical protein EXIGLDRAFT_600368 [Exidia glandulosa HHB12029]|uniref:C2H2-type domain-containing protein n=1 Tax=Exidia glandulosa HHB12029 TaxID=1314781 RepID=A0A165QFR4_EXIGL|nr:hypothetical protein EXIGLDRAFT_600368 [Exidia glandulosa HHB12029]
MQLVERREVTTVATQAASNRRRIAPARFQCPVAGCNATFTRRFNLRGHLRSHAEQRPYVCTWAGCGKSFARAHDCKRHETLHCSKAPFLVCDGCSKPFSRSDSLRRHCEMTRSSVAVHIAETMISQGVPKVE